MNFQLYIWWNIFYLKKTKAHTNGMWGTGYCSFTKCKDFFKKKVGKRLLAVSQSVLYLCAALVNSYSPDSIKQHLFPSHHPSSLPWHTSRAHRWVFRSTPGPKGSLQLPKHYRISSPEDRGWWFGDGVGVKPRTLAGNGRDPEAGVPPEQCTAAPLWFQLSQSRTDSLSPGAGN